MKKNIIILIFILPTTSTTMDSPYSSSSSIGNEQHRALLASSRTPSPSQFRRKSPEPVPLQTRRRQESSVSLTSAEEGSVQLPQQRPRQTQLQACQERCCNCCTTTNCLIASNCLITSLIFTLEALNILSNKNRNAPSTAVPPINKND